jgi:hypothetical protein
MNITVRNLKQSCLAIICMAAISLSACKKDSTTPDTDSTNSLLKGSWKMSKFEILQQDGTWIQTTPPSLIADATYTFKNNGTYTAYSNGAFSYSGKWSMLENGQRMQFGTESYHVDALNSSTLQLTNDTETFPYFINGASATYYGERDTYSH